jgi:hypothetical protein
MTCRDFQRKWDELLDADVRVPATGPEAGAIPGGPGASPSEEARERILLEHAAGCPECRQLANKYRVLEQATRAWRRPPVPSADLADRILAAAEVSPPSAWPVYGDVGPDRPLRDLIMYLSIATAAAVVLALLLPSINPMMVRRPRDGQPANPPVADGRALDHDLHAVTGPDRASNERPPLNQALAEATSATWELALSASEPAARISRVVLDATAQSEDISSESRPEGRLASADGVGMNTGGFTVSVPSLTPLAPDASAASAALQQVGDHLATGVRPLSDTARHAFGFLIGPAPDQAAPRTSPPSSKGA